MSWVRSLVGPKVSSMGIVLKTYCKALGLRQLFIQPCLPHPILSLQRHQVHLQLLQISTIQVRIQRFSQDTLFPPLGLLGNLT